MFSKELKILVALLFLLSALAVYRVATKEEPKRVKELTYKSGDSGRSGATPPLQEPVQKPGQATTERDTSKTDKKGYSGVIKNPFKPLFPPPPPPPIIAPKLPVPPPVPFPVITAKGPSPAQIESGKFKFLGLLQKEGDKKIFLLRDKEIFIVKKGDSVGNFHVGDITETVAVLIAKDTKEEFKITIEDVKPTKPGILPGGGRR